MNGRFLRLALAAILGAVVVFSVLFTLRSEKTPAAKATESAKIAKPARISPDSLSQNRRLPPATPSTAAQEQAGEADPEMIAVKETLRSYRAAFGENPIGTNAEITRALMGANSRKATFAGDELKVKDGQTVDRWGHPYFFHQLSRTGMEIRSAGPDGVMWTKDDEVMR